MLFLPDSDDALLTPKEAAEVAGVTTGTLANWARDGKVVCVHGANGHRRYPWGDLRAFLKSVDVPTRVELERIGGDVARLYVQGWSIDTVAKKFGRNYGLIHRLLIRKRVTLRHGPAVGPEREALNRLLR